MCICVLCVAFWEEPQTRFVVLGLAIDFFMRLLFGGLISPIGVVSNLVVIHQKPLYGCGPPKQFAALCGFTMSALSAALLLSGEQLGGTIVIGMLIAPTGAEGVFDFCLGCWIFAHAIRLKIVSPSVYRPYLNLKGDKKWAYNFMNEQPKQEQAEKKHLLLPNQVEELPVDLIRKVRIETEYKFQDVDYVKHAKVELFAWPLTLAALSFVFKLTFDGFYNVYKGKMLAVWHTGRVYKGLGIVSAFLFCAISILYLLRFYKYPIRCLRSSTTQWLEICSPLLRSALLCTAS